MRFAVTVFPGTWSDGDCYYVLNDILGQATDYVWHREADLAPYDCIILPSGFSYGDYLRAGAIARFSPVKEAVVREVQAGKEPGRKTYALLDYRRGLSMRAAAPGP